MCLVGSQASAADFTMSFGNTSAQVNITNANAGVVDWSVNGKNSLNKQSFFTGLAELVLNRWFKAFPFHRKFHSGPNVLSTLDVTYANASYSVRTLFQ